MITIDPDADFANAAMVSLTLAPVENATDNASPAFMAAFATAPPTKTITLGASSYQVEEGYMAVTIPIRLSQAISADETLNLEIAHSHADTTDGATLTDNGAAPGDATLAVTLTPADGLMKTITIAAVDDSTVETPANEQFIIRLPATLPDGYRAGTNTEIVITLGDND